jgi:hypothetical protein
VSFVPAVNYPVGTAPQSVAIGDFNRDANPDLAVANIHSRSVSVLLGNGNGTFQNAANYGAGAAAWAVAVGDFNRDRRPDLAVANRDSNDVSILLGRGDGTFQRAVHYPAGSGPQSVAVGDFNEDGKQDLAVADHTANQVSILLGSGNGAFRAPVRYGVGTSPFSVTVGDFDRDGTEDLAVANNNFGSDGTVSILRGKGDGTFRSAVHYGVGKGPWSVVVGSFDRDRWQDLAVANANDQTVSILRGKANGTFQNAMNHFGGAGAYPYSIGIADLDRNGTADLAVANNGNHTTSVFLGKGDGSFRSLVLFNAGLHPVSIAVADLNRDQFPDVVVANQVSNNVSVLLNRGRCRTPSGVRIPFSAEADTPAVGPQAAVHSDYGFLLADQTTFAPVRVPNAGARQAVPVIDTPTLWLMASLTDQQDAFIRSTAARASSMVRVFDSSGMADREQPSARISRELYGNASPGYRWTVHLGGEIAVVCSPLDTFMHRGLDSW